MSYALITGASKGIGKAFAEELAKQHHDVLLVARSTDLLQTLSEELKKKHGIKAHFLSVDLSTLNAADKIYEWIEANHYPVDILINNAGFGLWGNFHELDWNEQDEMMRINMRTLVHLCYRFIPVLKKQPKAYILNVASSTAYQALPTVGLYAATKVFTLWFSRAISHELKNTSISVSCLSPGSTKTNFVERSRMHHMKNLADKMGMTPEAVAVFGLKGMFKGKREMIPGFSNKAGAFLAWLAPKWLTETMAANIYKKK